MNDCPDGLAVTVETVSVKGVIESGMGSKGHSHVRSPINGQQRPAPNISDSARACKALSLGTGQRISVISADKVRVARARSRYRANFKKGLSTVWMYMALKRIRTA